ncbi:MAG: porin [Nitrospirota bacterium]|nr:porin [Nitrospirota bacterium]
MRMPGWQTGGWALGWFSLFLCFSTTAMAGDTLSDVLKEKGVITKSDWNRIQADKEKEEATKEKMIFSMGKNPPVKAGWGKKGFTLETTDGKFKTAIQWRFQGRFSYPDRSDEDGVMDFGDNPEATFELRRVRLKVGGHAYQPWIKHYLEVNWQTTSNSGSSPGSASLITWRFTLDKYKWAQLRIGQWKVNYNRERVDSSGKQQFVERSIVNTVFTLDRQMGAMLMGHLAPGTFADSWYHVGVLTGSGRGEANDDDHLMWLSRFQWNFFGRDLKFSQSDIEYHENPTASIAFGAYTNIGKCTRWSSSGCGTLQSGFTTSLGSAYTSDSTAADGQFRTDGMVEEFAMKWRGLSVQHEFHWKQIKDTGAGVGLNGFGGTTAVMPSKTNLMGSYSQIGYFPHFLIPAVPKPFEVAFRYAFVDPNVQVANDTLQEFTGAINWFFAGHRNKLTLDASHLSLATTTAPRDLTEQRVRLQWDVSF